MPTGLPTRRTVDDMTEDSVTKLYVPAAPAGPRESFPSLATQLEPPPQPSSWTAGSRRMARQTRSFGRPAIGLLVGVSCVLVGIAIGTTIAASGGNGVAAAATVPAAPAPAPVVTPIEPLVAPPPLPAAVPATATATATVTATDTATVTPTDTETGTATAAKAAAPRHHHHRAHHVAAAVAAPSGADGALAVSSKPPCKISIDGHDTGLYAPQRSIPLAPGHHRVTLSNPDEGIQLTTDVTVTAQHTTKLIRDFTN